ncbi:uncharacterized protein LOC143188747 [Calliopsis andreniformis]|uniref:uncharacterized protein LOC143188747 n=1 Tax=Calliopsis andreniformis TaxID=337506 RepID=UPI003FCCBEC4
MISYDTYSIVKFRVEKEGLNFISHLMDQLLMALTIKHLNINEDGGTIENVHSRSNMLIVAIDLLCSSIKSRTERILNENEVEHRNTESTDLLKNIEKTTVDVERWTIDLWKKRSLFVHLRRSARLNWKAWLTLEKNVEKNLKRMSAVKIEELSSEMLKKILKNQVRDKCIEKEIHLMKLYLTTIIEAQHLKENYLYKKRSETKQRCLDQLAKYDNKIGTLYNYKTSLLQDKNITEKEYNIIQNQLIDQRVLYDRLKEEREVMMMKVFSAKLEIFRRNRAAKIIQRQWRSYCMRILLKKKKSRK